MPQTPSTRSELHAAREISEALASDLCDRPVSAHSFAKSRAMRPATGRMVSDLSVWVERLALCAAACAISGAGLSGCGAGGAEAAAETARIRAGGDGEGARQRGESEQAAGGAGPAGTRLELTRAENTASQSHASLDLTETLGFGPGAVVALTPGTDLVVPLPSRPGSQAIAAGVVPYAVSGLEGLSDTSIDLGKERVAHLFWVVLDPDSPVASSATDQQARASRWLTGLSVPGAWRAIPAAEVSKSQGGGTGGCWVAVVKLNGGSPRSAPIRQSGDERNGTGAKPRLERGRAGQLIVDGKTYSARWVGGAESERGGAAVVRVREAGLSRGSRKFADRVIERLRASPLTRWQGRLYAGEPLVAPARASDAFDHPVIEAMASQIERRWQRAIDRVDREAVGVATEVRVLLARRVEFAGFGDVDGGRGAPGESVPLPLYADEAGALLDRVERDESGASADTSAQLVSSLSSWIEGLRSGPETLGAWVIDDAPASSGMDGAGERGLVQVGVINISGREQAASVATLATSVIKAASPEVALIEPDRAKVLTLNVRTQPGRMESASDAGASSDMLRSSAVLVVPSASGEDQQGRAGVESGRTAATTASVRVGPWQGERACVPLSVGATPPGLAIGPLLPDFTACSLLQHAAQGSTINAPVLIDVERQVVGRLYRDAARASGGDAGSGWVLYVECAVPPERQDARGSVGVPHLSDRIRLHFGSSFRPTLRLEVGSGGRVVDVAKPEANDYEPAQVLSSERGWSALIPIPTKAVERGRVSESGAGRASTSPTAMLRIGIMRIDSSGVRCAWPRMMLPWQEEPGRALIDLGKW